MDEMITYTKVNTFDIRIITKYLLFKKTISTTIKDMAGVAYYKHDTRRGRVYIKQKYHRSGYCSGSMWRDQEFVTEREFNRWLVDECRQPILFK